MDNIQKFFSDIDKIKKHYRAEHSSNFNAEEMCNQIADFFVSSNRDVSDLAGSFADYWMNTYILSSPDMANEPSADSVSKLGAMQALLEGSTDEQDISCLEKSDWKALCELVNLEAEDIPLELLNTLMMLFVDKQAL